MYCKKKSMYHFFFTIITSLALTLGLWASSAHETGWLVVLDGTSSAGKTSIAQYLKKDLVKKTNVIFAYESMDDFNTRKWEAEEQEEECKRIEKSAANAHKNDDKEADDDDDDNDDEVASKSAGSSADDEDSQADYLHYIKGLYAQGKNVIGDIVLRDDDDIKEYQSIIGKGKKIIAVMVYCPFVEITRRVQARNISGNRDEERTLYQTIAQIPDMFTISSKSTKKTIDSFTKQDIEKALKPLKKELEDDNKKKRKEGKKEDNIPKTLSSLRSSLSPKKGKTSHITPKMPHDFVVTNARATGPAAASQKIADYVTQRIHKEQRRSLKKKAHHKKSKEKKGAGLKA